MMKSSFCIGTVIINLGLIFLIWVHIYFAQLRLKKLLDVGSGFSNDQFGEYERTDVVTPNAAKPSIMAGDKVILMGNYPTKIQIGLSRSFLSEYLEWFFRSPFLPVKDL